MHCYYALFWRASAVDAGQRLPPGAGAVILPSHAALSATKRFRATFQHRQHLARQGREKLLRPSDDDRIYGPKRATPCEATTEPAGQEIGTHLGCSIADGYLKSNWRAP
jgi:hypothetical protein